MPNDFILSGGFWIGAAGSAQLDPGRCTLNPRTHWVFWALETGEVTLHWPGASIHFTTDFASFLPPCAQKMVLYVSAPTCIHWFQLDGSIAPEFVRLCGAYLIQPLPQRLTLHQMLFIKKITRVATQYAGSDAANFHLMQLLYAMLSSHCEQPVAPSASISPEIMRVLDALRKNHYRDNPSLHELSEIARLPQESFRKRFVNEVGMPPLQYMLACKMARAKVLLITPKWSVKAVAAEVGMDDPYHFSKQFKAIVGISPAEFRKLSAYNPEMSHPNEDA